MNDYHLNVKKIRRFLPEDESEYYTKDRPYSVKEIEQILSKCDVRSRTMVLIMASTGMRIGGLRELRIGDIRKIDEFGLYLIWVYNRYRRDRYFTFCTPECAVAIDAYLDFRRKFGEELKDESPLIRERFSIDNPFTIQVPKFVSRRALTFVFEDLLKRSGINNQVNVGNKIKSRAIMTSHGFRKFFINQSEKAGINYISRKYLVGHKLKRTDASYIRMTEEDTLSEYLKAIDLLTISSESKLRQQIQNKEGEIKFIQSEISSLKRCVKHMISMMQQQGFDTQETENEFDEYTEEATKRLDSSSKFT
jgi:integrase